MKKYFYLVLDVETANFVNDALTYDIGAAITDRNGKVYETVSFVASEIFNDEPDLMNTSYYAKKLPQYYKDIESGKRKVANFYTVRKAVLDLMKKYEVHAVCAYNAYFDTTALNRTERYITKSKFRWFFPYDTKVMCIWNMACQVICTQKKYHKFCTENGFTSKAGNISTSAETVYKFLTKDTDFDECHTGLEDVLIEKEIMKECFKKHKKMDTKINRLCWRIPQTKKAK